MIDEGVEGLHAKGVGIAHLAQRRRQVIVGVDVKVVNEGSRTILVGEDDTEAPCRGVSRSES